MVSSSRNLGILRNRDQPTIDNRKDLVKSFPDYNEANNLLVILRIRDDELPVYGVHILEILNKSVHEDRDKDDQHFLTILVPCW